MWHEYVTLPELKKRDDALADRDKRDTEQRTQAERAAHISTIRSELATAATSYPDLIVADSSLPQGFRITNTQVYNAVAELMAVKKPMLWRIKTALADLGMTPTKPPAKSGVKPTVPVSSPRTTAPPRKLKPNEHAVPAFIVGDENFE